MVEWCDGKPEFNRKGICIMNATDEEFDASPIAWEIYQLMYAANFSNAFKISGGARTNITNRFLYNGKRTGPMNFSGETDFNFTKGWSHTIYSKYNQLVTNASLPQKCTAVYSARLEACYKLCRSIVNISIMPQTGNLQGTKKGIGNDRIDTFLWILDAYYHKSSNLLTNYCTYNNTNALKNYLDIFGDVYHYCDAIYHIDALLVKDLIKSGKEAIDSVERVVSYMDLAMRFWKQKLAFLKSQSNQSAETAQAIKEADSLLKTYPA